MATGAEPPELPAELLDRLFRILYGPAQRRAADLAALQAAHPQFAAAIEAHIACADAAQQVAWREHEAAAGQRARGWSLQPGTRFGEFRIVELLGSGGMGSVFVAERLHDGHRLALKILHPATLAHREARERFDREAEVLGRLRHPGICEPLGRGEIEGCPYLAMRLVEGPTLAERIAAAKRATATASDRRGAVLPEATARALLADADGCHVDPDLGAVLILIEHLARALHAAHGSGVVHRDVKPSNVLLGSDGRPVLVDFGLATHHTAATLTATGDLLGTPAYMAPEQVRAGRGAAGAAVDVYALGAVLFECLTLRTPFVGASHGELLAAISTQPPPPLRELRPELPPDLAVVVDTALAGSTTLRYRSALDLADDLRRVRLGEPIRARRPSRARLACTWLVRNRVFTLVCTLALGASAVLTLSASLARSAEREADLLASAAFVAMAEAAEAELWPATPDRRERLEHWLARFAAPDDPASLPARLQRLELACGCTAAEALHADRHARLKEPRARIEQELSAIEKLRPVTNPGAMSAADLAEFQRRRSAWLRTDLQRSAAAAPAPIGAHSPAHREALLATARYVADGAEVPDRPGAIHRVRRALDRLRARAAEPDDATRDAWRAVQTALASGATPYREPILLARQFDLVPIGADPDTGLQEFAVADSGDVPRRDARGQLVRTPSMAMVLVLLPGGTTTMGTARIVCGVDALAFPAHRVALEPFFLGKFEATQQQWLNLGGGRPSRLAAGEDFLGEPITGLHPVENVNHDEAREVLGWHGLALPTEAQWEYAARAGMAPALVSKAALDPSRENSAGGTDHWPLPPFAADDHWDGHVLPTPVGSLRASNLGFHDLGGNVSEWCEDRFGPYWSPPRPGDGRRITSWGDHAVARGGNYMIHAEHHHRVPLPRDLRQPFLGVRAARRLSG